MKGNKKEVGGTSEGRERVNGVEEKGWGRREREREITGWAKR